jgi:hypothetical protein
MMIHLFAVCAGKKDKRGKRRNGIFQQELRTATKNGCSSTLPEVGLTDRGDGETHRLTLTPPADVVLSIKTTTTHP